MIAVFASRSERRKLLQGHTTALAGTDAMHEPDKFKKACRNLQPPEDYAYIFG